MASTEPEPLEILLYPDPFLRKRARAVTAEEFMAGKADGWGLAGLVERMKATLAANQGLGLAATQVGVGLRLFIAHVPKEHEGVLVAFNPVWLQAHGSVVEEEGCLSLPGVRAKVKRHAALQLNGVGLDGRPFTVEAQALLVRVCQHETDHLDGVLFINRLGLAGRLMIRRQLAELEYDYKRLQERKGRKLPAGVGR